MAKQFGKQKNKKERCPVCGHVLRPICGVSVGTYRPERSCNVCFPQYYVPTPKKKKGDAVDGEEGSFVDTA